MEFFNHYYSLLALKEKIAQKSFTPAEFTKIIKNHFNSNVIFKTQKVNELEINEIIISGYYDPLEDRDNQPCIEINIIYSKSQKLISINNIDWDNISFQLSEVIGHELIHQNQFNKRNFQYPKLDNNLTQHQEYLGNPDEIEAYGFSVAADFVTRGLELNQFYHNPNNILSDYFKLFTQNHYVVVKLFKFTSKYFNILKDIKNGYYR